MPTSCVPHLYQKAVFTQAVHERAGIESLAQSTEALKGTPRQAKLVDLNAVMADFDGEIERMFRFLGVDDPSATSESKRTASEL